MIISSELTIKQSTHNTSDPWTSCSGRRAISLLSTKWCRAAFISSHSIDLKAWNVWTCKESYFQSTKKKKISEDDLRRPLGCRQFKDYRKIVQIVSRNWRDQLSTIDESVQKYPNLRQPFKRSARKRRRNHSCPHEKWHSKWVSETTWNSDHRNNNSATVTKWWAQGEKKPICELGANEFSTGRHDADSVLWRESVRQ